MYKVNSIFAYVKSIKNNIMIIPIFFKNNPPSKDSVDQNNRLFRLKYNLELEKLCEQLNLKIQNDRKDLCCIFSVRYYDPTNLTQQSEAIGLTFNLKWMSERKFNYSLQYMLTENFVNSMGIDACVEYISKNIADYTITKWIESEI